MLLTENDRRYVYAGLILFTLASFKFYSYIGFNLQLLSAVFYLAQALMLGCCFRDVFNSNGNWIYAIMRYILLITWFSIIPAWVFWNQSVPLSVVATTNLSVITLFFFLWKHEFSMKELEKYIIILGFVYVILWLYSLKNLPMMTFGVTNVNETTMFNEERGMLRINFVGRTSLVLTYFLFLNKSFNTRKVTYIALSVFFFIMIVFQLTRQIIFGAGIVTIIYIFLKSKRLTAYIVGAAVAMYLFSFSFSFNKEGVVGSMIELTKSQTKYRYEKGDNRSQEYKYFFTAYSKNVFTDVFGNGVPYSTSPYGKAEQRSNDNGYYRTDVGYASIFVTIGWVGLILYLVLFYLCLRRKVDSNIEYAILFIGYMVIADVMASWHTTADGQVALATCAYILARYGKRVNEQEYIEEETGVQVKQCSLQ